MKKSYIIVLASFMVVTLVNIAGIKSAVAEYPEKPIYFIIPFGAGSTGDLYLREMLPKVSEVLGQRVTIVNVVGGGGIPGYLRIHDAKPDGYTIGLAPINIITSKVMGLFQYDYKDFTPLGFCYESSIVVLGSNKTKRPFKAIQEVVSFAKARPDELSVGVASKGYVTWIAANVFFNAAGVKFNVVTHEGGGETSIPELAGGHLDLAVLSWSSSVKSQIAAKNINILAIIGKNRMTGEFASVPTLSETGIDAVFPSTGLAIGPPNMPQNITNKLVRAFEIGAKDPKYREYLQKENVAVDFYMPPSEIIPFYDKQKVTVTAIMKKAGVIK